jgi:hypothetical protein
MRHRAVTRGGDGQATRAPKLQVLANDRQLILVASADQLTPKIRLALTSLDRLAASRRRA